MRVCTRSIQCLRVVTKQYADGARKFRRESVSGKSRRLLDVNLARKTNIMKISKKIKFFSCRRTGLSKPVGPTAERMRLPSHGSRSTSVENIDINHDLDSGQQEEIECNNVFDKLKSMMPAAPELR